MPVSIGWKETHGEQEVTIDCVVTGVETRADLLAELAAELPATYGTYILQKLGRAELVPGTTDVWQTEVVYGAYRERQQLQEGESEFKFSSVRRTYTRTIAIESRVFVRNSEGATEELTGDDLPIDAEVIGFKEAEQTATGVELTEYINAFSWRVAVPFSTASENWRRSIGRLRGSITDQSFFGYDARSVVFEDITGGVRGEGLYIFELSFEQLDNIDSLTIGGMEITNIKGWDVIDIDDQEWVYDTVRQRLIPKVREVKLHRVHEIKDWTSIYSLLSLV